MLFAAILGQMAVWLSSILQSLAGVTHPEKHISTVVLNVLTPVSQLLLTFLLFFYVIYLWLYFSRMLIYIIESPTGETLTFILGFVVLSSVCSLATLWRYWPILLAVCTLFIYGKNLQVRRDIAAKPGHPFADYCDGWVRWSGAYAAGLLFVGLVGIALVETKARYWELGYHIAGLGIVLGWSVNLIFKRFHSMEEPAKELLRAYANDPKNIDQFVNPE